MDTLDEVGPHLDPIVLSALKRWGRLASILCGNMNHHVRTTSLKDADKAYDSYCRTDKHYQSLGFFQRDLAKQLYSAIWIKEKDAAACK